MHINYISKGFLAATILLASCSTPKNITYFQDMKPGVTVQTPTPVDIRIKPEDRISIAISTPDPALSSLFTLGVSSNRNGTIGKGVKSELGSFRENGNVAGTIYTVSRQGDIEMPVLGKLHVEGMNIFEVAEYVKNQLISRNLVKDPIVTAEFVNTGIVVLGSVGSPGRYEFSKSNLNIIDAIAMVGDIPLDADRKNILVIRKDDNGMQKAYNIDLTDMHELVKSPVYYLQQDDIIYVDPNNITKRQTTTYGNAPYTYTFWIGLGSTALSIGLLIASLVKKN